MTHTKYYSKCNMSVTERKKKENNDKKNIKIG